MTDVEAALAEFHRWFEHTRRETPGIPDDETKALRLRLLREEFQETIDAMEADDLIEIADGLADLVYVAVGAAISYGIPFNAVFDEVHRTNMAKLAPCPTTGCGREPGNGCIRCHDTGKIHMRDAGGKTIKPPGWSPPKIAVVLGLETPTFPFIDPVSGKPCAVHLGDASGIEHPGCKFRAQVSPELDAFFCRECGFSGRISGAWFIELLRAHPISLDSGDET